jgi:hypothetical protein
VHISIGKTDDTSFSGWFCGAIRFFAQIAFFRGLNASELSQEIQNKLETVLTEC